MALLKSNTDYPTTPSLLYVQDGINIDYLKFKQAGGRGLIIRASTADTIKDGGEYLFPPDHCDQGVAKHVQGAYDAGLLAILYHEVRIMPDTYDIDWKTPGNGIQYQALAYIANKSVHQGYCIDLRGTDDDTSGHLKEALEHFIGVIISCRGNDSKFIVSTREETWSKGDKEVENYIGQPDFPHLVMLMNDYATSTKKRPSSRPGLLAANSSYMWAVGYNADFSTDGSSALEIVYLGTESDLYSRFGKPAKWEVGLDGELPEDPIVEDPVIEDPEDPPVTDPPVIVPPVVSSDLVEAVDRNTAAIQSLNATIREAWRLD